MGMAFKESVQEDLDKVFLDLDIWGEEHQVNGVRIPIMLDNEELERINQIGVKVKDDIHQADVLFYAKESDLGFVGVNELLSLDDRDYFIYGAKKSVGLWKIILGRKRL